MTPDQQSRASQIERARDALILAIGSDPDAPDIELATQVIGIACDLTVRTPELQAMCAYPYDPAES